MIAQFFQWYKSVSQDGNKNSLVVSRREEYTGNITFFKKERKEWTRKGKTAGQKQGGAMKHTGWKKRNLATGILLAVTLVLQLLAREVPGFAQGYSVTVYRFLMETLGRVVSVFPFSVAEMGLYALTLGILIGFVFLIYKVVKKQWKLWQALLRGTEVLLFTAATLFFIYTIGCGINYHRTAFSVEAGFSIEKSSREELIALCESLVEQINEAAEEITLDESGCMVLTGDVLALSRKAMKALGEEYKQLDGFYPRPKGVLLSRLLSVQKIEGIYSPFTLEANYNREMTDENIPVAVCHELSHLRGYMREDEANFIAYLACMKSGDPQFIYSGSILAFVHSMNALYRDGGKDEYNRIYNSLCDAAWKDLAADRAFWKQFDGKVAEVANKVNDTYLKVNKQEDGVKSYGRMVDLLLAQRREGDGK